MDNALGGLLGRQRQFHFTRGEAEVLSRVLLQRLRLRVAEPLRDVWIAVRASLRSVLEMVTLADVARGELPAVVKDLVADPEAWAPHP